MLNRKPMKILLGLGLIIFGYTANAETKVRNTFSPTPIANAGSDQTIYLTQTSTVTVNGSASSGDFYRWTDMSTDYRSEGVISSPTSSVTKITGLKQGTWYYQLAVTSGNVTVKDIVVIRVDYDVPPASGAILRDLSLANIASVTNDRHDTTGYLGYSISNYDDHNADPNKRIKIAFERSRLNGAMVDSSRGKLYTTLEDGYGWNNYGYGRSELTYGNNLYIDTNKTYLFEWKGYFPQSIQSNVPTVRPRATNTPAKIIGIFQIHGSDAFSPPYAISVYKDSIRLEEWSGQGNGSDNQVIIMPTDDDYVMKTHTIRITLREGMGYTGQDAFIKLEVDGVQKYFRNTGRVGQTLQKDYIKFASLYDWSQSVVDMNLLARGKKFSLVTEAFRVYQLTENQSPVAKAGADQTITLPVNNVTLSGSGVDTDGTIVSYSWAKISGPSSYKIENASSAATVVSGLSAGAYQFELKVTDNKGATSQSTVQVTVNEAANVLPVAKAGQNRDMALPVNITSLAGNGNDEDGTISSYSWTKISGPSSYNIVNASSPVTDVSELVEGVYQFELKVTDNKGGVGKDTMQITVNEKRESANTNIAPIANSGNDTTVVSRINAVTLNGSGIDTDGRIVSYKWNQISGPSNSTILSNNMATAYVNDLLEGTSQFELTVTDDLGAEGKDTVSVTVALGRTASKANAIKVYPNPVHDIASLEITTEKIYTKLSVVITDIKGRSVYKEEFVSSLNSVKEKINMNHFAKGTYIITVLFDGMKTESFKVIKL